jgi:hypothetical protein
MNEALFDAFQATHFLVCVDACEWADIRIDQVLPASVQALVAERGWGFITAWNPMSEVRAEAENLAAQRELFGALKQLPGASIHPAIGVASQWHEPSVFVIGADVVVLDTLARQHRQLGYVHGSSGSPARLRLLD